MLKNTLLIKDRKISELKNMLTNKTELRVVKEKLLNVPRWKVRKERGSFSLGQVIPLARVARQPPWEFPSSWPIAKIPNTAIPLKLKINKVVSINLINTFSISLSLFGVK